MAVTSRVGNPQARHFGLPAFTRQCIAVGSWRLCVNALNIERQLGNFLPYLHAKRTGLVLIQRQALALQINALLRGLRANDTFRPGQLFLEQHHRAENDAQGFKKRSDNNSHALS